MVAEIDEFSIQIPEDHRYKAKEVRMFCIPQGRNDIITS